MNRTGMMVEGVDYEILQAFVGDKNEQMTCFAMGKDGVYDHLDTTQRRVHYVMSLPGGLPLSTPLGKRGDVEAWLLGSAPEGYRLLVRHPEALWRVWPAAEGTLAEAVGRVESLFEDRRQKKKDEEHEQARREEENRRQQEIWMKERQAKEAKEASEAQAWLASPSNKDRMLAFISGLPRLSWIPMVEKGRGAPMGSRYGGLPWIPAGLPWPQSSGHPMSFVLQLDVSTLPMAAQYALGLTSGLIQVFQGSEYDGDGTHVAVVALDGEGDLRAPQYIEDDRTPKRYSIVGWTEYTSLPHAEDYLSLLEQAGLPSIALWFLSHDKRRKALMREAGMSDESINTLSNAKSKRRKDTQCPAPVWGGPDHLMGWPAWQQGGETPQEGKWHLLMEIWDGGPIGDLFSGDGTGYLFFQKTERGLRFKAAWQCG